MEEMNWGHAPRDVPPPPGGSVVPLLLLLVLVSPGRSCVFSFDPLSTTFPDHINQLTRHLLLDYPVSVPSNLEPDGWCAELWTIHFLAAELGRMWGVAGRDLEPLVGNVAKQISFTEECNISDPVGCVGLEHANVSQMLSALNRHMAALKGKMPGQGGQDGPADFSNCTSVRCQPGPLALLPTQASLPHPGFSSQKQPGTQASGAGSLHRSHLLVFLVLVPVLGYLGFVSLWNQRRHRRRLRSQGTQASEQADT
ncbi:fms-related tyrosine kinase 3 ligand [Emydura macquarii macquarii]|uniref:fms-related tyrosine kinase 3 ligand n=1 Tax=Emydura macquarii macquarii TaxID=1129001 RepID=UPI00352A8CD1